MLHNKHMQVLSLYQAEQKVIIKFVVSNSASYDPQMLGIEMGASMQSHCNLRAFCAVAEYEYQLVPCPPCRRVHARSPC
jgi:hypothetical protein